MSPDTSTQAGSRAASAMERTIAREGRCCQLQSGAADARGLFRDSARAKKEHPNGVPLSIRERS